MENPLLTTLSRLPPEEYFRLMDNQECMKELRVSRRHLYTLCKNAVIPFSKMGKRNVYIKGEVLRALLAAQHNALEKR